MMILISYDVDFSNPKGAKRLRKVAKVCEKYGVRVQNSVFETIVDPVQFAQLKHALTEAIDTKLDSVRFYHLGNKWESKIESIGADKGFKQEDPLIL